MVKICVVGCLHGELDKMYSDVTETELKYNFKTDIVLCCGDFQSIRNESDLTVISVPSQYRRLGDFWKYYASEKSVPYLTVFVGGNHEASNYLQELPYGGWVAPDVYYMGYAGILNFMGLRIVGISGIYKRHDYYTGHHEHAPYDDQSKRTAYHTRNIETFRLKQLRKPVDIVLSHDWPRGIYNYNPSHLERLMKEKPHFIDEIRGNSLGNPATEEILMHLKPRYWFAAHHHCKFASIVQFPSAENPPKTTKFLALDKCLASKNYMQFLDIEPQLEIGLCNEKHLSLDPEWLCVLKATNHLMSIARTTCIMPIAVNERSDFSATEQDLKELSDLFNNQFKIPNNFEITAPVHSEEYEDVSSLPKPVAIHINPQTDLMCAMLELTNPNAEFLGQSCSLLEISRKLKQSKESDEDSSDSEGGESSCGGNNDNCVAVTDLVEDKETGNNPEEIDIDDLDCASDEGHGDENPMSNEHGIEPSEQYDPADYPVDQNDDNDDDGYCPTAPFV